MIRFPRIWEMKTIRHDDTEAWARQASALGWKTRASIAGYNGPSALVFHGGPLSYRGFANGDPRYTLALLESGCELFDKERDVVILVRGMPTPERAGQLLDKYGVPTREAVSAEMPEALMAPEDETPRKGPW